MSLLLDKLHKDGVLSYLELHYTSYLTKEAIPDSVRAVFAALLAFSEMGHLCLEVTDTAVVPDLKLLWMRGSPEEAQEISGFERMIREGFSLLPEYLVHKEESSVQTKPFVLWKNRLYLERSWNLETKIIQEMQRLKSPPLSELFSEEKYFTKLKELEEGRALLPSQAKALRICFSSSVSFICGGPGTGKTYTAGWLLQVFLASLKPGLNLKVAVAAPTGKAVSHLKEKMEKFRAENLALSSLTLHSLLGRRKGSLTKEKVFPYDLIIIDEASMIDARMMAYLLTFASLNTKLIFLGDPDQLPPVESGSVFADLIASHPNLTAYLEKPMRFENKELIAFASAIQECKEPFWTEILQNGSEISLLKFPFDRHGKKELLQYAAPFFKLSPADDPKKLLKESQSFRILCSLREGPFGVKKLNEELLQILLCEGSIAMPILFVENDHVKGLYNGMNGILIYRNQGRKEIQFSRSDRIFFEKEGQILEISPLSCPRFELGYCLSVHKSQGSEYDRVLFVAPPGSEVFGREILYTAATRAKRKLDIFSPMEILKEVSLRSSQRLSSIASRAQLLQTQQALYCPQ
jgi:exodeoxyribonuclease V alpha subunit